ncbi:hypothetical protein L9F63_021262 [Diploptera punctata]|uniref:Gustatory receptor n=1 Tax=Diploptera punctata TaxID=6984 RepID=A0AAD7ZR92_DIPPU|nr:hypothetical protein L9F63_021262 [Diploptera punctata]
MDLTLEVRNIEYFMKPIHIISRLLGLSLHSPIIEPGLNEKVLTTHLFSVIWASAVFIVNLSALLFRITITLIEPPYSQSSVISCVFAMPLSHIAAMVSIILSAVFKRKEITELFFKLALVDKCLRISENKYIYKKHRNILFLSVIVTIIGLSTFYCFDIYVWSLPSPSTTAYEIVIHICYLTNVVTLMQFLNWVESLHYRLWIFCSYIPKSKTNMLDYINDTFIISKTKSEVLSLHKRTRRLTTNPVSDLIFLSVRKEYNLKRKKMNYRNEFSRQIFQLRIIYEYIYDSTNSILSIYGFIMLLDITCNVLYFISNTFSVLNILIQSGEEKPLKFIAVYCGWSFISLTKIILTVVSCHKISKKRESCVDRVQKLLLLRDLTEDAFTQLQLFADQLEYKKMQFNACGFFQLDLSLLNDIMTAATTYIIVLIQNREY